MISSDFSFPSKSVKILDSTIHYIDIDENTSSSNVFLFIHGNPTSSYLWRNIITYTSPLARSIAIDLIGFGKSGKPNIEYSFEDHIEYVNQFIEKLNLKNIILILHDWGGAIGFNYAATHSENIKGIVFMETFCMPMDWNNMDFLTRWIFKKFRNEKTGQVMNGKYNLFLKLILPMSINRKLNKFEKVKYLEPFISLESRKPIIKFPKELPFINDKTKNEHVVLNYYEWLKTTPIPKLLLYAKPGVQITNREVQIYEEQFKNLTSVFIGKGKHYIQEDQPENIGEAIENWYLLKLTN